MRGSWFVGLARGRAAPLGRAHAPGLAPDRHAPVLSFQPMRGRRAGCDDRVAAPPQQLTWAAPTVGSTAPTRRRHRTRARPGLGLRLAVPRPRPDAVHAALPLPRPDRRRVRLHRLRDRPPLPGHLARRAASRRRRRDASAPASAASTVGGDGGRGRSPSRSSTRAPALPRRPQPSTRSSAARAASSARSRRGRALARRRHPAAELAAYVLWSATVRPLGFVTRDRGADVQALDGQGVELGPLLQRPRPRAAASRAGLDQFRIAVRPPGRDRRAARLGHPLRGPLQLRQAAHPRLGPAAAAATARRPVDPPSCSPRPTGGWPRWTTFWLDHRRAPVQRAAALPARQRQRLGQRHHLRPRAGRRVADLAAFLVLQLRELAGLAAELGRTTTPRLDGAARSRSAPRCSSELWNGERFVARGADRRAHLDQRQPARPHADRRSGDDLPASRRERAGRTDRGPPHRVRPGHRTARPRRTTTPTATGAARSGRPPPSSSRTACAAPGTPTWPTRSAPASARCARSPASPRTSTPSPVRACATAPTPGPPAPTSARRPGIRAFDGDGDDDGDDDRGDGGRHGWGNLTEPRNGEPRPHWCRGRRRAQMKQIPDQALIHSPRRS